MHIDAMDSSHMHLTCYQITVLVSELIGATQTGKSQVMQFIILT